MSSGIAHDRMGHGDLELMPLRGTPAHPRDAPPKGPTKAEDEDRSTLSGVFYLMAGVMATFLCMVAAHHHHPDMSQLIAARSQRLHKGQAPDEDAKSISKAPWPVRTRPLVIAHRGASGLYPEHTRRAYEAAIEQGADVIECDVVLTQDLVGVCRHEPNLENTTNAAVLFPDKRTTRVIDGESITGIFACDLTLAEIRQLRAAQPWPFRDQQYNYKLPLVTLEEYLDIALSAPRTVGVYPETKHPTWHNALPQVVAGNTSIEQVLLQALQARGYVGPINSPYWLKQPAYIQSFEAGSLRTLSHATCLPMILLLGGELSELQPDGKTVQEMLAPESLKELSGFISGLAPGKTLLATWQASPRQDKAGAYVSSGVVEMIHSAGMQVHTYTLRKEPRFILPHLNSTEDELNLLFMTLGIDGAFNDYAGDMVDYFQHKQTSWNTSLANRVKPCAAWPAARHKLSTALPVHRKLQVQTFIRTVGPSKTHCLRAASS